MKQSFQNEVVNRRDFIRRAIRAGLSITAACSLSAWLYDGKGPGAQVQREEQVSLPDFSVPGIGSKMSIVLGRERSQTVTLAMQALGGMESFIKKDDRVLLKVNAAFATPPMLSATTNPQLVAEVARLCYTAGASSVVVTDNSINDPDSCFTLSGIAEAARSAGATVMLPRESFFRPTTIPEATLIRNWPILWEPFRNVNKVIGIAPVKDHHRSGASMTMKNWYGLLGGRRNIFHQDINTIIKELAMLVSPTFVILDGTTVMMTNGPTGGSLADLKPTNTMIISTDQVAADAFGATLLEKSLSELPFLNKAEAAGLGTTDYQSLNPIRVSVT